MLDLEPAKLFGFDEGSGPSSHKECEFFGIRIADFAVSHFNTEVGHPGYSENMSPRAQTVQR